ncbi:lpg1639 family Dot/Icm T4SS effector [Methylosoma difficile]
MKTVSKSLAFAAHGGISNSAFFNEYLGKLLEERDELGLSDMIQEIDAMMLTVEPGNAIEYIGELCLMSPYQYLETLESESHWTHVLRVDGQSPDLIVREVKHDGIRGIFRSLNEVYPIGSNKPHSRYIGEILRVTDLPEVVKIQQARDISFFAPEEMSKLELPGNLAITKPSPYTHNIVAYCQRAAGEDRRYDLGVSSIHPGAYEVCQQAKLRQQQLGIADLILPVDHLATRIYSQNREVAILEWLSLSSYYYWGSFDIVDQNSSTNVTKSIHFPDELRSPAKVFTANNTPYFVNHFKIFPSPTENYVRNYGPRLHHLALAVKDGNQHGVENIDYVVDAIREEGKSFLLDIIGSKIEGLKQIFSSASEHSSLIIEYVQRFSGFHGYFHADNVAELTHAAGIEEALMAMQIEGGRQDY